MSWASERMLTTRPSRSTTGVLNHSQVMIRPSRGDVLIHAALAAGLREQFAHRAVDLRTDGGGTMQSRARLPEHLRRGEAEDAFRLRDSTR